MCRSPVGRVWIPEMGVGEGAVEGMIVVIYVVGERKVIGLVVNTKAEIVVRM